MFILGNFIDSMAWVINALFDIMFWLIFIRAIISWFSPDPYNPLVQFLVRATDPILEPIRRLLPPMGIDISPFIACVIIRALQIFIVPSLYTLSYRFH